MPQVIGVGDYSIFVKWKVLGRETNKTQILRYVNKNTRDEDFKRLKKNPNVAEVKKLGK